MTDILSFIKPEVRSLTPYTLPDHAYRIKINQNENPFGFPAALKEEVWRRVRERDWARYPDFFLTEITARLADHLGVPHGWVLVGNGSNELLQVTLMATLGRGDRMVIPVPTFSLYKLLSRVMGAEVIEVALNEGHFSLPTEKMIETARGKRAKALIICTPNNPTGVAYPAGEVRRLIEETGSLIIIDEAYGDFSDQDSLPLLEEYENVVILRTFSKAMAMAGLRVGYLIARPPLVEQFAKAKLPYGLNILSEATALVALENIDLLQEQVRKLRALRDDLLTQLESIPGVHPYPSQANFILCRFDKPPEEVFNGLLEDGLLVRDVSHYPLLNGHLRISVGTREENEALVKSLRRIVQPSEG